MNRTDRLMGILLELQAHGERRAVDLARRFEVTVRTIYRDVEALSETGVPLVATPGRGYRLMEGYFLPPLAFTPDEAALLVLGGEFVQQHLDAEVQHAATDALHKLTAVLPLPQRLAVERWRREVRLPTPRPDAADRYLRPLRRAIRRHRVVRLRDHAFRRPDPEDRDVEPVRLTLLSDTWHLAAYCRLRQAPRFFRLNRINHLALLPETFELSERHAMGLEHEQQDAGLPEVRVRFDRAIERWVRERQAPMLLREEYDALGPLLVYAHRNEQELLGWLLGWGAAFEVLSPDPFRRRVAQEFARML
ncbi:MAG: helix-turn-helix transcriptional regulator, partial [Dehalococcoidia bacterium]